MLTPAATQRDAALLRRLIGEAATITVLSGAGLSTECGVPDFRSPGSPWRIYPPIGFKDFVSDSAMRAEAWRRKFAMDDIYAGARPGRGHQALTRLEQSGKIRAIITQNIDGLQQAAGFPAEKLIELHGNGTFARCLACGLHHDLATVRAAFFAEKTVPPCRCGGIVKSASIAFGQPLHPDHLQRAVKAAWSCDLFLVLGSSLMVRPASRFPSIAKQNGARIAIVNHQPTPVDDIADLLVRDDIGDVLTTV